MSKLNALEKSQYINDNYKDYLRSSFRFGTERIQKLFEEQLEEEELFKGPYLSLELPFVRGNGVVDLAKEGIICKSFDKLEKVYRGKLYSHQEEAIRHINAGNSAIVTTGTGSGKTECFLYPILNDLLRDYENGNREDGIRAIFLYPMNALVNDQIERLRGILKNCPEITFGFFTGDTKESCPNDYRMKNGLLENELVSREEIRENPPHILFTNYSMLEYLLIRPNDYSIFQKERLHNWKYVVLDEAHTYSGSLGIEISLLLRRLIGMAQNKPRFILTSATLGEQGKSEQDIIDFATSLTSVQFKLQDIIFSKRIHPDRANVGYTIKGEDYSALKAAAGDMNPIREISSRYKTIEADTANACLYELLIGDKNVFALYELLKDGTQTVKTVYSEFEDRMSKSQFNDMVDLINLSEKEGIRIFDLKYHSFVRPLSGAYVSFGKDPSLTFTKTNYLNGLRAFEVGNCRYCNSPYIIGKVLRNSGDDLDHLMQNNEVDIYENYGDNENINLDYFLIENSINEEEVSNDILEEYKLCSKCGALGSASNLNRKKCGCGEEYEFSIYKIVPSKKDKDPRPYNNITQCPCCGHKSNSGVVRSLNLGKDEATAIIAQMLYEAIDKGETVVKQKGKLSVSLGNREKKAVEVENAKQFLAFSDSRQQASFAAVFFDSTHSRMLHKRMIWKVIEDHDYNDLSLEDLRIGLSKLIKARFFFGSSDSEAKKTAETNRETWVAILTDLLKIDGTYDGEGMGLYYFDLNLSEIMDQISEEDVEESLGKYGIKKADLAVIMQVVLSVFKTTPAIKYDYEWTSEEDKRDALGYRRFDNGVMYNCSEQKQKVRSFVPIRNEDNFVTRYIQKVCGCNSDDSKLILDMIFNGLAVEGGLFSKYEGVSGTYQIDAKQYVLKNYRNSKYYRCDKCGRLTPYNVHDKCVQDKCSGKLYEVDPDEVLQNNYYRKQYKTKRIEKIRIEEHTAQLSREEAKRYQKEFVDGKINILSCSTTFEMGIDIGDLETVFMRNVPPTPANYVQRAGRAGRAKDSTAYILTYCGVSSHDYTFFCEPQRMISGQIRPPYFNILNKKIIVRHIMAACLGFFFRKNEEYFKNAEAMVFDGGIEEFYSYINSKPQELLDYIDKCVIPEDRYSEYHNFGWLNNMGNTDERMDYMSESMHSMVDEYERAKNEALKDEEYGEAEFYKRQIAALYKERILDVLSKYSVIPKYGFPVDLVDLQTYEDGKLIQRYDMTRDLKIAISEYAPDSEVIVDKNKYTSKYVVLPKAGEFPKHYFRTCPKCKKINLFLTERTGGECKFCGENMESVTIDFFIEPVNGFKTGKTKSSASLKPKRSYAGEVFYVGGGKDNNKLVYSGESLIIETTTDDELMVINKSDFYMCPKCGYSKIVTGRVRTPEIVEHHSNCRQYECNCEDLSKIRLGHSFKTDVARIIIPSLEANVQEGYSIALSAMYAILEGVSLALGIERTDIDGVVERNEETYSYDLMLYDNVPGGAGHVKRLVEGNNMVEVLKSARDKVSIECCDEDTSCYKCLRNYYNQSYHTRLKRKYARDFINELLMKITSEILPVQ